MGNAARDANYVPTLIGVSNADGTTPITVYVDPTTHRMLVTTAINFADNETPSGTVNGTNATFTLANAPSPAGSLILTKNGVIQKAGGVDYTLSSLTITFVTVAIPLTGDILIAWYRY